MGRFKRSKKAAQNRAATAKQLAFEQKTKNITDKAKFSFRSAFSVAASNNSFEFFYKGESLGAFDFEVKHHFNIRDYLFLQKENDNKWVCYYKKEKLMEFDEMRERFGLKKVNSTTFIVYYFNDVSENIDEIYCNEIKEHCNGWAFDLGNGEYIIAESLYSFSYKTIEKVFCAKNMIWLSHSKNCSTAKKVDAYISLGGGRFAFLGEASPRMKHCAKKKIKYYKSWQMLRQPIELISYFLRER